MGRKKTPGLFKRNGIWHIDKQVQGKRLRESTGSDSLEEAERYLAHRIEELRKQSLYGDRAQVLFKEAALRFVEEKLIQGKATLDSDVGRLKLLYPYIGSMPIDKIHMGTLEEFIVAMKEKGKKNATINHGLKVVRQILRLASTDWRDDNGNTWLLAAPRIKLLNTKDSRAPRPLEWHELNALYDELPEHLSRMARFAANSGCRDKEICELRWEWEYEVPELSTSVFIIPAWVFDPNDQTYKGMVKNRQDRLVVLNKEALRVVEACRNNGSSHVFTYRGKPVLRMLNSAWKTAREKIGIPGLRVHDLKHTFGMALRAAGVSEEDRRDLLGHKSGSITTHYSAASIENLIIAANTVCDPQGRNNILTLRPKMKNPSPHNFPTRDLRKVASVDFLRR